MTNPVAVAEFLDHICRAVLEDLFATNSNDIGVLGDVSNHFGVVETNGRGMIWFYSGATLHSPLYAIASPKTPSLLLV